MRQKLLLIISVIAILLPWMSLQGVEVTARGKFNHADHEAFSRIPSDSLFHKGTAFMAMAPSEPDSAMLCFTILTNRYEENPRLESAKTTVEALINISYLWREAYYDYPRAYQANMKALKLAEEHSLKVDLPYIYMGMASILQNVETGDTPLEPPYEWLKKSLQSAMENKNHTLVQYAVYNLTEMIVTGGSGKSVAPEWAIIRKYKFPANQPDLGYTRELLDAIDRFNVKDYPGAVRHFDLALEEVSAPKRNNPQLYLMALEQKISTLKIAGDDDNLPALYNEMLQVSSGNNYHEFSIFALKGLRDYYAGKGDRKSARDYDYQYLHLTDSLQRLNNLTRIKDLAFIAGLEEAGDKVQRISSEKRHQEIIAVCGGVVALIIIVALILYIRSQKRLHEANLKIYERLQQQLNSSSETELALSAQELTEAGDDEKEEDEGNSPAAGISPQQAAEIYAKVTNILETSPEIYSQDFSIRTLASLAGEPYYAVSAAINHCSGSNFKTLLMDYRLREACRRLSDYDTYGNQTIESIALSLGFKSRTYFNSVFKKLTGLTPAVYMKIARAKKDDRGGEL